MASPPGRLTAVNPLGGQRGRCRRLFSQTRGASDTESGEAGGAQTPFTLRGGDGGRTACPLEREPELWAPGAVCAAQGSSGCSRRSVWGSHFRLRGSAGASPGPLILPPPGVPALHLPLNKPEAAGSPCPVCSWPVRTAQAGWGTASPHPFSLLPEDPGGLPGPPESHLSSLHGKHEPGGPRRSVQTQGLWSLIPPSRALGVRPLSSSARGSVL